MTHSRPLPRWIVALAAVSLVWLVAPIVALAFHAGWGHLFASIGSSRALEALWLSGKTSVLATLLSVVLGIPLALWMSRKENWLTRCARAVTTLPLVMPPIVAGLALLYLFGKNGLPGWFHASLAFSTAAVVLAQAYVAMPFLVITVESAARRLDPHEASIAATLGAGRWRVIRTVTLPQLAPAIGGGTVLAFARALGEFGATAMFAGNLPGVTQTMPLAIYTAFNGGGVDVDAAIDLALVLIAAAAIILVAAGMWRPARAESRSGTAFRGGRI